MNKYTFEHNEYTLNFLRDAVTSRGILNTKETHVLKLWKTNEPDVVGIGETGLFRGLSADDTPDFEADFISHLNSFCSHGDWNGTALQQFPSSRTAIEMAMLDLHNGGNKIYFKSEFTNGFAPIPINGLIWMGDKKMMHQQIVEKIEAGFNCIKLKIGALDFETECSLIAFIRKEFDNNIIVRVDANGAFTPDEALEKLSKLSEYDIHSIEQPIMAGQWEEMASLVERSPIDIALDEELIGIYDPAIRKRMLEVIKPEYIILKPSLLGGFATSEEWIALAASLDIGWWVTSALESNIGLNAIAQWTASLLYNGHQGLGTGALFSNNFDSPLFVENGYLHYKLDT